MSLGWVKLGEFICHGSITILLSLGSSTLQTHTGWFRESSNQDHTNSILSNLYLNTWYRDWVWSILGWFWSGLNQSVLQLVHIFECFQRTDCKWGNKGLWPGKGGTMQCCKFWESSRFSVCRQWSYQIPFLPSSGNYTLYYLPSYHLQWISPLLPGHCCIRSYKTMLKIRLI